MKLLAVASALASFRDRRVLLPLFLGFAVLCPACVTAPPGAPEPSPAPVEQLLEEGRPVERVLGAGETHEHRLAVEAGWYVRLEVEQVGVDVVASLLGLAGTPLMTADSPGEEEEVLAAISPASGDLRVLVSAKQSDAVSGIYRMTVIARRPAGPGDADRAAAEKALSEARLRVEKRDEQEKRTAIPFFEEAARCWEVAGERSEEAATLNELGKLQRSLSEIDDSIVSNRRALALAEQAGDRERQATSLNNLAVAAWAQGELAQALDDYQKALALWVELGDLKNQGSALYGMGIMHWELGNLDEALLSLSRALPLRQAAGEVVGVVNTLTALGGVHLNRGEIDQASERLQEAFRLSRSPEGAGSEASPLQTMAQVHRYRGEFGEAEDRLREARDIYRQEGNEGAEVRALNNLGGLYRELGDLDEAQRSFDQGLALVAGKNPDAEARLLNNLGWIQHLRGDPAAAITLYERSLARAKDSPSAAAQALGLTGVAYVANGRVREGLQLLQRELDLRRQRGERSEEARSLLEIATAWQALGDLGQAAQIFREALALGRQVGNTSLEATCLYRWAVLDRQRGDLHQALDHIQEALRLIESVRSRVTREKLRTTFLASRRAWYELEIDLRLRLEETEPRRGHLAAALEASERARSRGLLDLLAEGRIELQEGIGPELKRKETGLGARLSWLQDQLGRPEIAVDPEGGQATSLRTQLDQTGDDLERLEEEIRRLHPHYAEVRYPTPLRLEQIQGLLEEGTALLEYFVGQEASFLFVVTRHGLSAHRLPRAGVLEQRVLDLREALEKSSLLMFARFRSRARDVYDLLLGPAATQVEGLPNLLISPDGPLYFLPFEALLVDAQGSSYRELSYLIRQHAISYVPSASVLAGLREPRSVPVDAPSPKTLIAFGAPVVPPATQTAEARVRSQAPAVFPGTTPELPGTLLEVSTIADLYPRSEVEVYVREQATEENVKTNPLLQTARQIHFATHGFIDEVRPQLSGLMLTRNAGSLENGLLQVYEIFNLRLGADLVTLSACETALGKEVTGEGMIGLTRAFLYAGARSLLVSLWPVSDVSTPELMAGFYRHLGGEETKAEALRQAKLERIRAGSEPYRWAPFALAGDPL